MKCVVDGICCEITKKQFIKLLWCKVPVIPLERI